MTGRLGGFGDPPELVVSGINPGPNTGRSVLHSGTVGAALTAGNLGLPALAISIGSEAPRHFDTAATVAASVMAWLLSAPAGTVLNVNVPDLPIHQVRGVREAPLARFGPVETTVGRGRDGDDSLTLRVSPADVTSAGASGGGTDAALVAAGFVTVTCIAGVRFGGWTGVALPISEALRSRSGSPAFGRS
jgi:5'-nucleotidase